MFHSCFSNSYCLPRSVAGIEISQYDEEIILVSYSLKWRSQRRLSWKFWGRGLNKGWGNKVWKACTMNQRSSHLIGNYKELTKLFPFQLEILTLNNFLSFSPDNNKGKN
jgi:hypothetical protein